VVFWVGAVVVACMAVAFAQAANWAGGLFLHVIAGRPWLPFIIAPAGLTLCFLLTRHVFPGAQGSGIPQTIAALHMEDQQMVSRVLSLRIAVGKVLLTLMGLASGQGSLMLYTTSHCKPVPDRLTSHYATVHSQHF
jgi:H+/Cl- antiporter ClcA